jgi:hypothetical protein
MFKFFKIVKKAFRRISDKLTIWRGGGGGVSPAARGDSGFLVIGIMTNLMAKIISSADPYFVF